MEGKRNNQAQLGTVHFVGLVFRDGRLQGDQVFGADSAGFVEKLPPSVLASRFCAQHHELAGWKGGVVVLARAGKQEIRFGMTLRDRSAIKAKTVCLEDPFKVVLERMSCA